MHEHCSFCPVKIVFFISKISSKQIIFQVCSAKCTEQVMINWSDISTLTQTLSPVDQMCLVQMMSTHTPPLYVLSSLLR